MKSVPGTTSGLSSAAHGTYGAYARRLIDVATIPGGVRAQVGLIPYRDLGDERHPIIVSAEPLQSQTLSTNTPNRPQEHANALSLLLGVDSPIADEMLLEVQALSARIVHIRLGSQSALAQSRDFGMIVPGMLADLNPCAIGTSQESTGHISVTLSDITLFLQRDPFAFGIGCTALPDATVETALDDRNVHGLLITPPPGILVGQDGPRVCWSWALTPDEHLYGLGERFTRFDQRGEQVTLWNTDAWGTTTEASYKYVPFLQSSRGYGLFFHTPAAVTLQLGTPSARAAQVSVDEEMLDLFVIFGATPKEILTEYTRLTGRATMPPRWAFGTWLSRCRYESRAEVEAVAARARAEDVPCDVLHIDPAWLETPNLSCDFVSNETAFPDLAEMIHSLGERGFKVSLWELPYVSSEARRYREAADAGFFLRDDQGQPINASFGPRLAGEHMHAILDFTNPDARRWWQDQHRPWLRAGVDVFKTDFGEGVPEQAHAFNGMTGRTLHNLFPLLYNAAVHEVITQETGRPGMVWGRSGWAGTQRYPAQWGGDPKTDAWSMASSLRGGLNLALSAPGIWAHDIGGFYGPPPSPELYIRWAQFGLLSPLARAHGTTPREPWEFGEEALAIFRRYAKLRVRLNPYLYTMAWEAHEHGWPMLRPLVLEFPDDPIAAWIDDVYLLGARLLVAPIFSESRALVSRKLYLPAGEWFDFWTGEHITGGAYITRLCELDTIPLYVRAGTLLPLGPERPFIGDELPDELTINVYPGADSTTQVVWDTDGNASILHLQGNKGVWKLDIEGERSVTWSVCWHTGTGIVEADPIRSARATFVYQ
jgi:alpha-D-xyloside xylohydrolase